MTEILWEIVKLIFVVAFYSKDIHPEPNDPEYSHGRSMFRHLFEFGEANWDQTVNLTRATGIINLVLEKLENSSHGLSHSSSLIIENSEKSFDSENQEHKEILDCIKFSDHED